MDGWTDGWMDGWMDEWMNGWMDESNLTCGSKHSTAESLCIVPS